MSIKILNGVNGSQLLAGFFNPAITYPITLCGFFKLTGWNSAGFYIENIISTKDSLGYLNKAEIYGNTATSRGPSVVSTDSNSYSSRPNMLGEVENVWVPFVAVFASKSNRKIYSLDTSDTLVLGENTTFQDVNDMIDLELFGTWSYGDRFFSGLNIYNAELTQAQALEFMASGSVDGITPYVTPDTVTDWGTSGVASLADLSGNDRSILTNANWIYSVDEPVLTPTTSITPSTTTPLDGALLTITPTGMTGAIISATIAGKDKLADLSSTDSTAPFNIQLDDIAAGEVSSTGSRIGQLATISIETAVDGVVSVGVSIMPKAGWAVVNLAATLIKTETTVPPDAIAGIKSILLSIDDTLGITTAIGNQLYFKQLYGETCTPQGLYDGGTLLPYQFTEVIIQQGGSATTVATSYPGAFYPFGTGTIPPEVTGKTNTKLGIGPRIGL